MNAPVVDLWGDPYMWSDNPPITSEIAVNPSGQYDILAGIPPRDVFTMGLICVMLLVILAGWVIDIGIADYKKYKEGRRR